MEIKEVSDRALVIFSGGLDSTTCLYWAVRKYDVVHTLTFFYNQRNKIEIDYAKKTVSLIKKDVKMHFFRIDLSQIGGSALTDRNIPLPKKRTLEDIGHSIPITYVPFRNGIFLSIVAAFAEKENINNIIGGWNTVDFSGYPDCRKDFLKTMEKAINLGTKRKSIRIIFPLIHKSKTEIIKFGKEVGVDYSYAYSCYEGKEIPCGECDSCILRRKGFKEAGYEDDFLVRLKKESKLR
ncbi:MAG: 7-cyano-7-deazaguanine synthase QueC [Deltaproteobacteria bacterium]|nr:7-cyano-7-deazaguanine synthase QueC [Deltaproteobacteria bacterium]